MPNRAAPSTAFGSPSELSLRRPLHMSIASPWCLFSAYRFHGGGYTVGSNARQAPCRRRTVADACVSMQEHGLCHARRKHEQGTIQSDAGAVQGEVSQDPSAALVTCGRRGGPRPIWPSPSRHPRAGRGGSPSVRRRRWDFGHGGGDASGDTGRLFRRDSPGGGDCLRRRAAGGADRRGRRHRHARHAGDVEGRARRLSRDSSALRARRRCTRRKARQAHRSDRTLLRRAPDPPAADRSPVNQSPLAAAGSK